MFKKLSGVIGSFFRIGLTGNAIKHHADGLEARAGDDGSTVNMVVARATANTHAATYLDLKERAVLIEYSFTGATPPSPGANTGKYGICHTTGGSYSAGELVLDNGTALVKLTIFKGLLAAATTSVTGAVSMIANGLYVAQAATTPFSWTLKGDASLTGAGYVKVIQITVGATAGAFNSTEIIPSGAVVLESVVEVTTLYDGTNTLAVTVQGSSPVTVQAAAENNVAVVDEYSVEQRTPIGATGTGVVRATLAGDSSVGAAEVYVSYVTPLA
jgi:hypothetical protein